MTQHYGSDRGGPGMGSRNEPGDGGERPLRAQAQQVGEQARAQARSALDQQARTAAEKLDHLADGARAAAQRLEEDDDNGLSEYVSGMAGSLGELADSLRSKNVDELVRDVRMMAQRNPALFITGSLAIGFGLARFARASAQRGRSGDGDARLAGDFGGSAYGSSGHGTSALAGTDLRSSAGTGSSTAGLSGGSPTHTNPPGTGGGKPS